MIKAFEKDRSLLQALCLLLALVFAAAGPANAVKLQDSSTHDLAAYTLPDGTLPIICFGNGDPVSEPGNHCDECLQTLSKSKAVTSDAIVELLGRATNCEQTKRRQVCSDLTAEDANHVRGPPLS